LKVEADDGQCRSHTVYSLADLGSQSLGKHMLWNLLAFGTLLRDSREQSRQGSQQFGKGAHLTIVDGHKALTKPPVRLRSSRRLGATGEYGKQLKYGVTNPVDPLGNKNGA